MGEVEMLMGPSWPIIIKMAEAMFKRDHPNAEWSPGRASPIWFARAEEALPIVTAACAEVAREHVPIGDGAAEAVASAKTGLEIADLIERLRER